MMNKVLINYLKENLFFT